jgi:hypothetical protein
MKPMDHLGTRDESAIPEAPVVGRSSTSQLVARARQLTAHMRFRVLSTIPAYFLLAAGFLITADSQGDSSFDGARVVLSYSVRLDFALSFALFLALAWAWWFYRPTKALKAATVFLVFTLSVRFLSVVSDDSPAAIGGGEKTTSAHQQFAALFHAIPWFGFGLLLFLWIVGIRLWHSKPPSNQ